jgi:hypothetical protein
MVVEEPFELKIMMVFASLGGCIIKGPVQWKKKLPFLRFGKFMKNGAFFVFTACSESL